MRIKDTVNLATILTIESHEKSDRRDLHAPHNEEDENHRTPTLVRRSDTLAI